MKNAKETIQIGGVYGIGIIGALLINIMLTKRMSDYEFGQYIVIISLIAIINSIITSGHLNFALNHLGKKFENKLKKIRFFTLTKIVTTIIIIFAIIYAFEVISLESGVDKIILIMTLILGSLVAIGKVEFRVNGCNLKSQISDQVIFNISMIFLISLFNRIDLQTSISITFISLMLSFVYILKDKPVFLRWDKGALRKKYINKWIGEGRSFVLIGLYAIVSTQIGIIILGNQNLYDEIVYLKISQQICALFVVGQIVINIATTKKIRQAYANKNLKYITEIVGKITRINALVFTLFALIFYVNMEQILKLLYSDLDQSKIIFSVIPLLIAQIVNISFGNVGTILQMTGGVKLVTKIEYYMMVITILLMTTLALHGKSNAYTYSIVIALIIILSNAMTAYTLYKKNGILPLGYLK